MITLASRELLGKGEATGGFVQEHPIALLKGRVGVFA